MRNTLSRRLGQVCLVAAVLVLGGVLVAAAGAVPPPTVTTVVSGLDNPRDLAFGPDGSLYVAEAGHGGPECFGGGEEGTTCVGFTSQISKIDIGGGTFAPIVTGFVSTAGDDGSFATGIDGVSVSRSGSIFGIETGSADSVPDSIPGVSSSTIQRAKAELGRLLVDPPGRVSIVADVGDRDFEWSAGNANLVPGQFPDANPYGVFALNDGEVWVVDAGANTLDRVQIGPGGRWNSIGIAAFVPNPPSSDSVPTCVDRGPDGALYIGILTGGGNVPGASIVYRYTPQSGLTQWATGLTAVTGCGFAPNGTFYAVEFSTLGLDNAAPGTGALVAVPPHSISPTLIAGGFSFPGGFAAGPDGSLYFSNWSIAPASWGTGSVVQVKLP